MAKPATLSEERTVAAPETERAPGPLVRKAAGPAAWADERVGAAGLSKYFLRKVFPDHWSFLLGEIALYSFVILLITGVFLTIWYKPSMAEIDYEGSYQLLRGLAMSEAYESTLNISFDIRGGLLMRQVHHWSATLFVAAMFAHMLRVFFTGAFRKPREINWVIGVALLGLGVIEGFAGYSLPDDLLSGTGLRFVDGLVRSIPVIGTWAEFFIFGGEFPGTIIISRLYMVHILLVPGLLLALIAAHLALLVYHKHSHFPGPGRTDKNVVGYPLYPVYMAKAGGFFFIVFGVTVLMGALMQINPVWSYGPYNPSQVTAGSQPDWYMGWVEGAVRIMPGFESHWGSTTWSWNVLLPGVFLLTLLFVILGVYPWVEAWLTGDKREHHLLERPRTNATRTAFGVAGITCFIMFMLGGGNDILATQFRLSLNAISIILRVAVFVAPVLAFIITKRICIALQRVDQERLLHGSESGIINRSPVGGYSEDHLPIAQGEAYTLISHNEYPALEDEDGVSDRQKRARRWFYGDNMSKPTRAELEEAAHHAASGDHHDALDGHGSDGHAIEESRRPALTGGKDGDTEQDSGTAQGPEVDQR